MQSCSFDGNGGAACAVDLGSFVTSTGDGGDPISTELFTTYTGVLTPIATLVDGGAVITQGGSGAGGSSSATNSGASTPSASAGGSSAGGSSGASAPPQTSGGGNSTLTNAAARGLVAQGHYEWLMASCLVGIISGIWLV